MFAEWHMLDIFFLILACYFVIKGCFRGFVGEILTLVGFLVSIYVSFKFSGTIGNMLERSTGINIYLVEWIFIVLSLYWQHLWDTGKYWIRKPMSG